MAQTLSKQIPWLRVVVEGLVIVISILLALATDAWWQKRSDRAEEQAIIEGLVADYSASLAELRNVISTHDDFDHLLVRLQAIATVKGQSVPRDSVGLYLRAMFSGLTFEARDGTLDAVIASGKLGLISDIRLREALVEWKALAADLSEEATELRTAGNRVIDRMSELGGPWALGAEAGGRLVIVPRVLEGLRNYPTADLPAVIADSELAALLRVKRYRGLSYLSQLIPLLAHAEQAAALIQANSRASVPK